MRDMLEDKVKKLNEKNKEEEIRRERRTGERGEQEREKKRRERGKGERGKKEREEKRRERRKDERLGKVKIIKLREESYKRKEERGICERKNQEIV